MKFLQKLHDQSKIISVKIAISGGEVYFSLLGNQLSSHYVVVGDPVWSAKALQDNINPGEVLVAAKAWRYVQESNYIFNFEADSRIFKIMGFKANLEIMLRQQEAIINFNEMEKRLDESEMSLTMFDQSTEHFSVNAAELEKNQTYTCELDKFKASIV